MGHVVDVVVEFKDSATEGCADGGEPTTKRNLKRLRKHTMDSNAADTKEDVVDVVVEFKDSATYFPMRV
nr:unnamed protein product [Digitaria exilis]